MYYNCVVHAYVISSTR